MTTTKTRTEIRLSPASDQRCSGRKAMFDVKRCEEQAAVLFDSKPYCRRCLIWQAGPTVMIRALNEQTNGATE